MKDPPIRALYVSANNPAVTCPEAHKVRKGLAREDLFTVVHDPFMTDTASYADIVLPAATYLETDDLYRAYGAYWMQWGQQAATPRGEARSNFDVAQALAQRMGLDRRDLHADAAGRARRSCSRARPARPPRPIPAKLFAGEPIHIAHDGRASRSARRRASSNSIPSSSPRRACRRCPTGTPDPIEVGRCRAVAAAPADRARLLPGAHRLLRRRLPAPARGQAVLHPASRRRRQARPRRTAPTCACSTTAARSAWCSRSATRSSPASCWCPASARRRGGRRHHQHALLRPLHRHRRGRDLPEHLPRCRAVEGRAVSSLPPERHPSDASRLRLKAHDAALRVPRAPAKGPRRERVEPQRHQRSPWPQTPRS